ncbi:uncharacterized protein LOC119908267, partial [Micropterus salmoides]|uniref:uncharacterized protein LOC119908267 n=1 Tax=Micropterus salmoides TaxID=27706 RepID=UPI0018EBC625
MTYVDLGTRSDTGKPNQSPEVAILPFLRVPQNCPRTYKLMSFDPDGDKVRCRYGNIIGTECSSCNQPSGFDLDQGSCTLHYRYSYADARAYGFELVVEDFPQGRISLAYTDGSRSSRDPLRKRQATTAAPTTIPTTAELTYDPWWWFFSTTTPTTTTEVTTGQITTTEPTYDPWWWFFSTTTPTTTTEATTGQITTTEPTYDPWWWFFSTTTPTPTTEATTGQITTTEPTYDPWWWFFSTTTPTPTTEVTTGQITTAEPTDYPWWWFFPTTTPTPTTEVTTGQITTAEPTDYPWWWFFPTTTPTPTTEVTTGQITTAEPTDYPWWWFFPTTTPVTTTIAEPTYDPWWWFGSTTTPTTATTGQITTAEPTYDPWEWFFSTTTPTTEATTTLRYTSSRTHLHSTTPPLSKLPLQFSVLVDPPAPSCQEGLFLPKFVNPTPENGAHIQAEVNKEVEIRVKAQAAYATIRDIIISGPLNIQKHRTTHDEFVIRWTPTPDDLGAHYPICFAVESVTGADIYQSEMRCVLVDIVATQVVANVICSQSTMTVEVEKSSFSGLNEDHLRLSDPTNTVCSLRTHSNSTHIIAVIPLNACGTQIEEDDDNLIFKNEITAVDNTEDLITRKHLLEVQFYCQYPKRGNVTLGYTAHRKSITVWEKGFGTFTYQFEFFPDNQFQTMIDPNSYPLEYDVGSRIYMQIDATSANNT